MNKEEIIDRFHSYEPAIDAVLISKAYEFSEKAHSKQARASGEHYFVHCHAVASSLVDWKMDLPTICAGLLHDVIEDTPVKDDVLRQEFGDEITKLVLGMTKLDHLQFQSRDDAQAANWRKMLLATAQDIRVIIIKLADRLHNMKTINFLEAERQKRIAEETISLYAPLAHRLGMFEIKSELEDLAFAVLEPKEYHSLSQKLEARIAEKEKTLAEFTAALEAALASSQIPHRILTRTKSIYSIYQKMLRQAKPFEEIQDALGVRIITDTISHCYALLGMVHSRFKPLAGTFTDYISLPKINLYQSLHTTVMGPQGALIEVQIRTEEMNRTCEYGIAAHWRYKTGDGKEDLHLEEKLNWLRQWIEWLQDLKSPREFLESLATDLTLHQVFVFTPNGEVKVLPAGATPLDFAFAVHTEIGYSCIGAVVNNKMVKLDYELQSGDICQVLTRKNSNPKKDWLQIVRTARARSRIRRYLRDHGLES